MPTTITVTALVHIAQPRFKYMQDGTAVCNISGAATTRDKRGNEDTIWIETALWGARGEAAHNNLSKGDLVLITGTVTKKRLFERNGVVDGELEERVGVAWVVRAADVTYVSVKKWSGDRSDEDQDSEDSTDAFPF